MDRWEPSYSNPDEHGKSFTEAGKEQESDQTLGCTILVILAIVISFYANATNREKPGSSVPRATSAPTRIVLDWDAMDATHDAEEAELQAMRDAEFSEIRARMEADDFDPRVATYEAMADMEAEWDREWESERETGSYTDSGYTCDQCIKGNIGFESGDRIYHFPGCENYDETVINSKYGERWFSSEAEARAAGWRKARNCP